MNENQFGVQEIVIKLWDWNSCDRNGLVKTAEIILSEKHQFIAEQKLFTA